MYTDLPGLDMEKCHCSMYTRPVSQGARTATRLSHTGVYKYPWARRENCVNPNTDQVFVIASTFTPTMSHREYIPCAALTNNALCLNAGSFFPPLTHRAF